MTDNTDVEESPDYDPVESETDWKNDQLGTMADYATADNTVELEEGEGD